jgi:hypothetical protein
MPCGSTIGPILAHTTWAAFCYMLPKLLLILDCWLPLPLCYFMPAGRWAVVLARLCRSYVV